MAGRAGSAELILAVNAGSSSLKLSLCDERDRAVEAVELDAPGARVAPGELGRALRDGLGRAHAVAHRIVHGGERFREATLIDARVVEELAVLSDLAPLHQTKSLAALEAVSEALPDLPAVACFDTAFHATLPAEAFTHALPASWRQRWGIRRYGFHGLSHPWAARRAAELLGRTPARLVSCHLGAGASLCAIPDGCSVDTTMGFTPLEGLVMATRSGSVDPGLLLWLLEHEGMASANLAQALEHESGLAAPAGTADMREVVRRAEQDDERASAALGAYIHRLAAGVAAMAASLGGLDALLFTGGVGENSASVRGPAAERLAFLGVRLDGAASLHGDADREVGSPSSPVRTLVVHAREDAEMARQARVLLAD